MSSNSLISNEKKPKFSVAITTPTYQKLINNTLGDANRSKRFIATITSSVAVNPALQDCDAGSILAGALLGESLGLSPSPQLGQFYLVPFNSKKSKSKVAQFIIGYKGYIQLAIRSGQYRKLNVTEIKEGELNYFDPLNESIDCTMIDNFESRENIPTVGYYAMFEYINGFQKAIYWSKEKMLSHADKYSQAFSEKAYQDILSGKVADSDMGKYSSFWYKNFDDMAKKTMLRQIISHWGIMSTEMQTAINNDSAAIAIDGSNNFFQVEDVAEDKALEDESPLINNEPGAAQLDGISFDEL